MGHWKRSSSRWNPRPARKSCIWVTRPRTRNHDGSSRRTESVSPADAHADRGDGGRRGGGSGHPHRWPHLRHSPGNRQTPRGIGADIMVQSPAAQMLITFSGSPMPIKIADKLAELKYVQAVAPVLLQFNSTGGVETVWGIDAKSFRDVSSGFVFLQGHDLQDPDDILVDDWQAKAK